MQNKKIQIRLSTILIGLLIVAGLFPVAGAVSDNFANVSCLCPFSGSVGSVSCLCPFSGSVGNVSCLCPFSDVEIGESCIYCEFSINSVPQNSSCNTCGGSSTVSSFTYSNAPLIIPAKDTVLTGYEKISVSTPIMLKDQILAKYLK
jgi:hypothetical protein